MKSNLIFAAVAASSALFIAGCATEPEAPKPPPPPPVVKPAPKPVAEAPKAAPKKPAVVNLASTELFEFNRAVLTNDARAKLDAEVIAKLKDLASIRYIIVNGHADRLGSASYNQKLSERRAEAVRAYLVSKGADAGSVETLGFGKTLPVKSCPDQKDRKSMIECLSPNRRVVVEVQGTPR